MNSWAIYKSKSFGHALLQAKQVVMAQSEVVTRVQRVVVVLPVKLLHHQGVMHLLRNLQLQRYLVGVNHLVLVHSITALKIKRRLRTSQSEAYCSEGEGEIRTPSKTKVKS